MTPPDEHASNPPHPDPLDPDTARALGVEHLGPAAEASADGLDSLRERVGRLLGGYSLGECLGRGGMGAVFLAHQERLDRKVAVKVLIPPTPGDEAWLERFQREARALARLSHPNIVAVHDFGQAEDLAWIVLEYVEGASLRQVLNGERLSPAEALAIVPQVCAALQYAHERGVIHRDIKPENILLDVDGNVKIADFGLAKLTDAQEGAQLTATDQAMGTLRYMAPEQLERPRSVDHRADIFALGVVFYELLTGRVPVGRVEPPSSRVAIDVRLDEIVLRALEREPEKRYQSAHDVRVSIADLQGAPAATHASMGAESSGGAAHVAPARARSKIERYDSAPLIEATRRPLAFVDRAVALVALGAVLWPGTLRGTIFETSELEPFAERSRLMPHDPFGFFLLAILCLPLAAQVTRPSPPLRAGWLRLTAGLVGLSVMSVWLQLRQSSDADLMFTRIGVQVAAALFLASATFAVTACVTLLPSLLPRLARRRMALDLAGLARLRWIETALFVLGLASLSLPWTVGLGGMSGWDSAFGLIVGVAFGLGLLLRWAIPLTAAPWIPGATSLIAGVLAFTVAYGHAAERRPRLTDPPSGPILALCMGVAIGLAGLFAIATTRDAERTQAAGDDSAP